MLEHFDHVYEFGPFRLIPRERCLLHDGQPVPLRPKAFDTLLVLVENSGHLVEKDELMKRVWRDTQVEEVGLARNISALRKALGENPSEQHYIETVTGHGYRFIATVSEQQERQTQSGLDTSSATAFVTEEAAGEKTVPDSSIPIYLRLNRKPLTKIALPASLVIITSLLLALALSRQPVATDVAVKSIAVLPFKLLNPEGGQEHLGLGMADALITRLSNLKEVTVLPTSAVGSYDQTNPYPMTAGQALKVEAVLEGSVQRSGEKVRVTVRLIRARDGRPLWADKFDSQFTDIFALQDSISAQVAGALAPKLSGEEKKRLAKRDTENPEAYLHYLKGQYHWNKRTAAGLQKSIEQFQQAIDKDPAYALAYAGLANSYVLLSLYGDAPPREWFPKAKAAATRALEIDQTLGEAQAALGFVLLAYDWNWPEAEKAFKRALELSPNNATAYHWYGWYLITMGRFAEAVAALRQAQELDPLSQIIGASLGGAFYYARQYDQAIEQLQKTLEIETNFAQAHQDLGRFYIPTGDFAQAIAELRQAMAISGNTPRDAGILGYAYAASGHREQAQRALAELKERARRQYVCSYYVALVCAGLGEKDQAFAWLRQAVEERSEKMLTIKYEPLLDSLRSDPRFQDLLREVGFTP